MKNKIIRMLIKYIFKGNKIEFTFNINDKILVRLNDLGYQHLANQYNEIAQRFPRQEIVSAQYFKNRADSKGYSSFQAWDFIETFGPITGVCKPTYYNNNIIIQSNALKL